MCVVCNCKLCDINVLLLSSLQQFVKDTGGFVSEMAQALLNGLTGGRHRKLLETIELKEGKEQVSSKRGSVVSEQVEGDGVRSIGELLEVVRHRVGMFVMAFHGLWFHTCG